MVWVSCGMHTYSARVSQTDASDDGLLRERERTKITCTASGLVQYSWPIDRCTYA